MSRDLKSAEASAVTMAAPVKKREIQRNFEFPDDDDESSSGSEDNEKEQLDEQVSNLEKSV